MKELIRRLSMLFAGKLSMGIFIVLFIYTLTGFLGLPFLIKPVLEEKLSLALTREVMVRKVTSNPFTLCFTIRGVTVSDHDREPFFSLEELFLDLELSSLLRKAAVIKELSIKAPYLRIVQQDERNYNFSDLLGSGKKEESPVPAFYLGEFSVTRGKIEFDDRYRKQSHTIGDLRLLLSTLSSLPGKGPAETSGSLDFALNGAPVKFKLKAEPFAKTASARAGIDIKGLSIPQYLPYMPFHEELTGLRISGGTLDLSASLDFQEEEPSPRTLLSNGEVRLTGLLIEEKKSMEKILSVPALSMGKIFIDPGKRRITLGEVSSEKGMLNLKRASDGSLNLQRVISPSQGTDEETEGVQGEISGNPWQVSVDSLRVTDYTVDWKDLVPATPAGITLGKMEIQGSGLSTAADKKGRLSMGLAWNGSGSVRAEGDLGLSPLSAELAVEAKSIGIDAIQPYFTDRVRITVTSGDFNTKGLVSLSVEDDSQPLVSFRGDASITDFASVDRPYAHGLLDREPEDFLRWGTLTFSGVDMAFPGLSVAVDGIALSDFYSRIVIYEEGTLNLATVFSQESEEQEGAAAESRAPSRIAINRVTFENGEIDFSDHLQKPGFTTSLKELGGNLSGLSSMEETFALVSLSGTHGNAAPLSIQGKINPLIQDPFADITVSFKGIELPRFTPYSARYLGYKVHKGKLDLDLGYRLDKGKIAGENRILFDQFTLGDKVESPLATSLPISLGISLLSDRKGRIHIDLPVQGDLADPEFSFGGMIFKALGNLITKIVTSPFDALGAMFGGGAELSHVEFEYGRDRIGPAMTQRLEQLASALHQRPGLFLEIRGATDNVMDRKSLMEQKFENILRGVKLDGMVKTGLRTDSLSHIRILPEEVEPLTAKAFETSPIPKPVDPSGQPVVLSSDEIKQQIMAHIKVPDGELRELAARRAGAVKAFFLTGGKIAPERLFLLDPQTAPAKDAGEKSGNRVNFSMR